MILERHYDEEALIAILNSGADAIARDPHLSGCSSCTQTLQSYQAIAEVLGDKTVWQESDDYESGAERGAAAVRAFVDRMDDDDANAAQLADELAKLPRQWWVTTVRQDSRYHTTGALRRLTQASEGKTFSLPPDAVELASAAIAVAEILGGSAGPQIKAAAYRQHAFASYYVGDFPTALDSVEAAQRLLDTCAAAAYDEARLDIVRAYIFGAQEQYEKALSAARRAARCFRDFGDRQRLASALLTETSLLIYARQYREALSLLGEVRAELGDHVDLHTRAVMFQNVGVCQKNLGHVVDALDSYRVAAALYDENGTATEAVLIRHNVGLLLASQGRRAEAKAQLQEVQGELQRLGLVHSAVVAGLDMAEIALLENNFQEVEDLCRAAIRQFQAAGVAYSSEALTALTFLREAAEQRRATQEIVWHVKTYIRRLPDEPTLLFAPAPLPPS